MSPDSVYRIAHVSDPHLTSLAGIRAGDICNKRILGYLSWLLRRRREHRREVLDALVRDVEARRPDHVVITGDLTHVGTPRECGAAAQWLREISARLPVTLIPGNHDRYVSDSWGDTLGLWTDSMAGDGITAATAAGLFPSLRMRGPLAIIGLSSAVPSPPFFATGTLGERQLADCDRMLEETGRAGRFRLLLIHHPPAPGAIDWRRALTDAHRLQAVLARRGAELVLHGHSHRWMSASVPGPAGAIPALGIPSASALTRRAGRRAGYALAAITPTAAGWDVEVTRFVLSSDAARFEHGETHRFSRPATTPR